MADYRYILIKTGCSSERYGSCDVCGEHAAEVFHQIEERKYIKPNGEHSWTRHHCSDLFGHKSCLIESRKE